MQHVCAYGEARRNGLRRDSPPPRPRKAHHAVRNPAGSDACGNTNAGLDPAVRTEPAPRQLRARRTLPPLARSLLTTRPEQKCAPVSSCLLERTRSDSAAFARASTTTLAGEGRAAGIACVSSAAWSLHMHPAVGVCSIGYDEQITVLLLRQERGHQTRSDRGFWSGRRGAAVADCCFPGERRSVDGGTTSQIARLHVVPLRPGKGAADRRRSSSSDPGGSSRPSCTSAPAGSLGAVLQARRAGACSVSAQGGCS